MKKTVLCGHTGSNNRGCNAIIKSTVALLSQYGIDVVLATHDRDSDQKAGLDGFESVVEYLNFKNGFVKKWISVFLGRVLKERNLSNLMVQKKVWDVLKGKIAVNVGGDTYCYSTPYTSIYLNKYCEKNDIVSVLWGCSIEKGIIEKTEILEDLKRYAYIFPRETLTYNFLKEAGFNESNLILMSDPAFALEPQEVKLPKEFKVYNTIGLNVSPTVLVRNDNPDIVIKNYCNVIDYVLDNTECSVALIPHVYDGYCEDLESLSSLYEKYKGNERVLLITEDYNSHQLKYIISKLRFLIAARTHASIAAYSSFVPTLVLGYSIKAKGIALDLFGTYDRYVLPVQELKTEDALLEAFQFILESENDIRDHLVRIMPQYKDKAKAAASILRNIADEN